ncbi:recombinase family protein [Vibrio vulnificus]|uniref:recombinase family protein n=1 Tax=Vibrio vulnificus TaxID=672 RepID=UPI0010293F83|nr:recombinase family protein [Vibrio vulnificus]RZP86205.1 recombinase family protein [Vibrio vulnificus]RZR40916.1 recombinase family protein [Vibrio vulnificus]
MKFNSTKPQVYSYRRFSSPLQEKGTSLARQTKLIEEVASRFNLEINESLVMTDRGLSAFHAEHKMRGELGLFLRAVKEGLVKSGSVLIVESLDRLSREDAMTASSDLRDLINHGISVVTAMDGRVYSSDTMVDDPMNILWATIVMIKANEESMKKFDRSIGFIKEQVSDFYKNGVADVAGTPPFWIRRKSREHIKEKNGFEFNENENVIRIIVDMYFRQGLGLRSISRELGKRKILSPKGHSVWGVSTLSSILENEALCGKKVFKLKTKNKHVDEYEHFVLDGYYPAVITEDEFDKMQAIKKRKAGGSKGDKSNRGGLVYFLTDYGSKSVCAKCGGGIGSQPQKQKNRIRRRLHCYKHKETENCCRSIIQDYIEDAFLVSVSRHIDYSLINRDIDGADLILIDERLSEIDIELENAMELFISVKDQKMKTKLQFKYESLELEKTELSKKRNEIKDFKVSEEDIKTFITTVEAARDYRNNDARKIVKNILVQCIKKLSVHMEKLRLEHYGYPNIYNNTLVNVIDVEFYSEKELSIFVCAETNALLFTRISNEFASDAMGSYTEEELNTWNDFGREALDALLEGKIENKIEDNQVSPEKLWFGTDLANVFLEVMAHELNEN